MISRISNPPRLRTHVIRYLWLAYFPGYIRYVMLCNTVLLVYVFNVCVSSGFIYAVRVLRVVIVLYVVTDLLQKALHKIYYVSCICAYNSLYLSCIVSE